MAILNLFGSFFVASDAWIIPSLCLKLVLIGELHGLSGSFCFFIAGVLLFTILVNHIRRQVRCILGTCSKIRWVFFILQTKFVEAWFLQLSTWRHRSQITILLLVLLLPEGNFFLCGLLLLEISSLVASLAFGAISIVDCVLVCRGHPEFGIFVLPIQICRWLNPWDSGSSQVSSAFVVGKQISGLELIS